MKNKLKLILVIFFMYLFFNKITYSEEGKFNNNQLKKQLVEKKLLLNYDHLIGLISH